MLYKRDRAWRTKSSLREKLALLAMGRPVDDVFDPFASEIKQIKED
ncbi:MAG: hypothetical protein ACOY3J_07225 [Bacillota bacterium]|uniref:Uncharacterized protein n=1 Tax=Thermanaerosceptrum fracticalcis TaxID=1712410 RepID=A0A7G6E5E2_THEFR|nr:hypothetical protein [Thermanaerosceptrum fracticalcis]QNB47296.1 hypothetical protein BR63_13960 [Thermanaerosceptrum fracticalcis]